MKVKKELGKTEAENKTNIWKITSIVFISLFTVMILLGVLRTYHFRYPGYEPSDSDIAAVKAAVIAAKNASVSSTDIQVFGRMRPIPYMKSERRVIEATIDSDGRKEIFLVDLDTKEIVMHSETEFFGWMKNDSFRPMRMPQGRRG